MLFIFPVIIVVTADPVPRVDFGKSNVTMFTDDVYAAGMTPPEEFQDEMAMISFSKDEPIEGELCIINATIFNIGTRSASITVYFYDGNASGDDLIGTDTLEIMPLGHGLASADWDTTGEDENHTIYVYINTDDPANETDESNNQANKDILVNQIPTADAGEDQTLGEDDIIEFNGMGTDSHSDITAGLTYIWEFNDPYADEENPSTVSGINITAPTHYYTKRGTYTVNLTIRDDGGAEAEDSITINIFNHGPTAVPYVEKFEYNEDEVIYFSSKDSR